MIFLLFACTPAPVPTPSTPTPLQPTPWDYSAPTETLPTPLETARIEAAGQAAIDRVFATNPHFPFMSLIFLMSQMEETCPTRVNHNDQLLTQGDCTDSQGNEYYGFQVSIEARKTNLDLDGFLAFYEKVRWMSGVSRFILNNGIDMRVYGDNLVGIWLDAENQPHTHLYLWGDWYRQGTDLGEWLEEDVGVELYLDTEDRGSSKVVDLHGGISRITGDYSAVVYEDLHYDSEVCALEPTGRLRLLAADRRWYTFDFGDNCDGCAHVQNQEGTLADLCIDFSEWQNWENSPWIW